MGKLRLTGGDQIKSLTSWACLLTLGLRFFSGPSFSGVTSSHPADHPLSILPLAHPERPAGPVCWPKSERHLTAPEDTVSHWPRSGSSPGLLLPVPWANLGPHRRTVPLPCGELTPSALSPAAAFLPSLLAPIQGYCCLIILWNIITTHPSHPACPLIRIFISFLHTPPFLPALMAVTSPCGSLLLLHRSCPIPNYSIYISLFLALSLATLCGNGLGRCWQRSRPVHRPWPRASPVPLPSLSPQQAPRRSFAAPWMC